MSGPATSSVTIQLVLSSLDFISSVQDGDPDIQTDLAAYGAALGEVLEYSDDRQRALTIIELIEAITTKFANNPRVQQHLLKDLAGLLADAESDLRKAGIFLPHGRPKTTLFASDKDMRAKVLGALAGQQKAVGRDGPPPAAVQPSLSPPAHAPILTLPEDAGGDIRKAMGGKESNDLVVYMAGEQRGDRTEEIATMAMGHSPHTSIEGYSRVILGGDKFLDYWGPQTKTELATVGGVYAVMERAYQLGIRGFDISLNTHVIEAFRTLRGEYADVVGVGNPNWKCGIKLRGDSIYDIRTRIIATLLGGYLAPDQLQQVKQMPQRLQERWFPSSPTAQPLTSEEIQNIFLDEDTYRSKLAMLVGVVDFILIGTDYADWLIPLGRVDILSRMAEMAKEYGFRVLSVSHWGSLTLPVLDKMEFEAHWIYLNSAEQLLSREAVHMAMVNTRRPITAFRVLGGGLLAGDMTGAFDYLKSVGVGNVVIGAENVAPLETILAEFYSAFGER